MSRWILIDAASTLGQRLEARWRALPKSALALQLLVTLLAFAAALGATVGVTMLTRHWTGAGLQGWDVAQLLQIRDQTGWASVVPLGFTDGIIFESPANILILLPVTLLCAVAAVWRSQLLLAVQFLLCYGLGRVLILTGWRVWPRPRPDLIADGAAALSAHSFPSGHAVLTLTTYGLLAWLWIRRSGSWFERLLACAALALLAAVVGYGRLLLGAHWPSDVLAGWLIGVVWLLGNIVALTWASRRAA